VLDGLLRLLHPITPFVTEAIWQHLNSVARRRGHDNASAEEDLVTAAWPRSQGEWINEAVEKQFAVLQELIRGIRQVRMAHNVPPSRKLIVTVRAESAAAKLVQDNAELICSQAGLESVFVGGDVAKPDARAATVLAGEMSAFVADAVDVSAERARMDKERQTVERGIAAVEGKLGSEQFITKAPPAVVKAERERLAKMHNRLQTIYAALAEL